MLYIICPVIGLMACCSWYKTHNNIKYAIAGILVTKLHTAIISIRCL